jgi:hypothetical protein
MTTTINNLPPKIARYFSKDLLTRPFMVKHKRKYLKCFRDKHIKQNWYVMVEGDLWTGKPKNKDEKLTTWFPTNHGAMVRFRRY